MCREMSDMYAALRKGGARGLGWQGVVVNLVISSHFAVVPVLLSVTDQVMYTMPSLLNSSRLPSCVQRNERYVCCVAQGGSKGIGLARVCS